MSEVTLTPALSLRERGPISLSLSERAGVRVSARTALLLLLAGVALSACGKKGAPSPPGPPDQITYPRTYPAF